ncbi:MAG: general secretion pathway protein GspK [Thermoguttaceae bacterium]
MAFLQISKHRGVILVAVLVVVVLLTLSVFAFSKFMSAERRGANHSLRQRQSRLLAESGIDYLRVILSQDAYSILEQGGIYDNEDEFCGHIVTDGTTSLSGGAAGIQSDMQQQVDPREVGRFSVIAPMLSPEGLFLGDNYRFGLEDESCKVNLRWILQVEKEQPGLGRAMLMRLPGIKEEIADSILDWMDDDSEEREYGAEDEYYANLDPPYYTRNGIPDSIDELILVKGISPKLLYGIDWNRNGILDLGEPDETTLDELDDVPGNLNLGLAAYLTLDSRESNRTPDGLLKIDVNMDDLDELRTQLSERFDDSTWADYIISFRQQSASGTAGGQTPVSAANVSALLGGQMGVGGASSGSGGQKINSLLDLVAPRPESTLSSATNSQDSNSSGSNNLGTGSTGGNSSGGSVAGASNSPFEHDLVKMNDYLPILYDNLSLGGNSQIGRVNINQAPRTILELFLAREDIIAETTASVTNEIDSLTAAAASFGLGSATSMRSTEIDTIIEGILAERISDPAKIELPEMNYPFWIYTHGIVEDFDLMKQLEPYFCSQGAVFKANVIGRFDEKSPVRRLEVWLDASDVGDIENGFKPAKILRIRDLTELGPGYSAEMLGADPYSNTN